LLFVLRKVATICLNFISGEFVGDEACFFPFSVKGAPGNP
jgi:hypothetical protein